MKKVYMNPNIQVVKLQSILLQAASGNLNMHSGTATEWGSREGSSLWDDDDEE